MIDFGELCRQLDEKVESLPLPLKDFVMDGLESLSKVLRKNGVTVACLKSHQFVESLSDLEHCSEHALLCDGTFGNQLQMIDALKRVFKSLSHSLAYCLMTGRSKLMEVMNNCPFDFWEARPYLVTRIEFCMIYTFA